MDKRRGVVEMLSEEFVRKVADELAKMPMQDVLAELRLLSVRDAAKLIGISGSNLYALASRGEVPAHRIGGRLKFRPKALLTYIYAQEMIRKPESIAA